MLNETSNVRQLGDDYIDEATCLLYGTEDVTDVNRHRSATIRWVK